MQSTVQEIYGRMQQIFTADDMTIFAIVLALICLFPVFISLFRGRGSVRGISFIVFIIYVFGNLSFTLLNREVMSDQAIVLRPTSDFQNAFYLDLGLIGTIRRLVNEGVGPVRDTSPINRGRMAREVFLNILLYVPLGYLLPFVFKSLRGHILLITVLGLICSFATEFAQLTYHIGCFQVDDIVCNTIGTLIGAILGSVLSFIFRVR